MPLRATVIGDAVVDVHVTGGSPRPGDDVPAAISLRPGGQAANVAVRLARRGAHVRLACALADDAAGRLLTERLAGEGVEVAAERADRTGAVVVLVGPGGERSMLSQRVPLTPRLDAERTLALAAGVDWVVVSGYLLLEPAAVGLAAALADAAARRVVLGCALGPGDAAGWRAAVTATHPSLLVLNAGEAAALTGIVDPGDGAARLAQELRAAVVVTEPGGAVGVVGGARIAVGAPRIRGVVDTTGAGDAFAAALLATLASGAVDASTLGRALDAAVEAGTAAARVIGAQGRIRGERDRDRLTR